MQTNLETVSQLERRLHIAVPSESVNSEVDSRLKKLARTVRLHGFRPGKVPLKVVTQQYGSHIRQEVLGEALQKRFVDVIREQNLKVAGYPRFEAKSETGDTQYIEYSATFEVYPEVTLGDMTQVVIRRPKLDIGDTEVDRTIEILRKQRCRFVDVNRPAENGDQVHLDFLGTIDGAEFKGGSTKDLHLVVGEGKLLKAFEEQLVGMTPQSKKTFDVSMPSDYHDRDIAEKTVVFEVTLHGVAEPILPEVDAEFAKQFGIDDGDLAKMKDGVKANLVREVQRRVDAKVKEQVMQALVDVAKTEPPKSLLSEEIHRLVHASRQNLEAKGVKTKDLPIPPEIFESQAKKNVSLGIIIGELVQKHRLDAKPEQVKMIVQHHADTYEHPEEVVRWYYQSPERLKGVERLAIENNVVEWALSQVKTEDEIVNFEDLMGKA